MMRTARFNPVKHWQFVTTLIICMSAITAIQILPVRAEPSAPAKLILDEDGTVHVPPMDVPPSEYLSPEAKAYLIEHLKGVSGQGTQAPPKNGLPGFLAGYLDRSTALFPTHLKDTKIAGVHVYVYTPKDGVSSENEKRVLINLHGGGFGGCWPGCAALESIPISSLGRIKVVSVDYREGPKYHFPAASEDVAAVYSELLKTYPAQNIGIYGCSAGGMLVGMSEAWFQTHGLPNPGGLGIFCAGMTLGSIAFGGDANYLASAVGEMRMPAPAPNGKGPPQGIGYLAGVDHSDPLAAPGTSLAVLAKFPPTLIITGTRGFEFSSAVYTDTQLVKAGAESDLHVWEGLFHGFFYNPDVPESRDCYNVIVKFFDRHLGK